MENNRIVDVIIPRLSFPDINVDTLGYFGEDECTIFSWFLFIFASATNWDDVYESIQTNLIEGFWMDEDMTDIAAQERYLFHEGKMIEYYFDFNDTMGRMLDFVRSLPPGYEMVNNEVATHTPDAFHVRLHIEYNGEDAMPSPRRVVDPPSNFDMDSPLQDTNPRALYQPFQNVV